MPEYRVAGMDTDISRVILRPGPLERLRILSLQVEGARELAEMNVKHFETMKRRLEQALTEACADEGMHIPPGQAPVHVDWQTGMVDRDVSQTNGVVT